MFFTINPSQLRKCLNCNNVFYDEDNPMQCPVCKSKKTKKFKTEISKIRKEILVGNKTAHWWTYKEKNKYYLMANDYKIAEFTNKHDCEIFERDFKNQIKKGR